MDARLQETLIHDNCCRDSHHRTIATSVPKELIVFWDDLTYLNRGSERQREAFRVLIDLDVFSMLAEFEPVLAGSFPLGIETPQSDLDIICWAEDLAHFTMVAQDAYGDQSEYMSRRTEKNDLPTVICNFQVGTLPIELFAQPRHSEEQNAYRHLIAEARLLREGGAEATLAIRDLKLEGMKTEPAFGQYFCLPGDPYEILLTLADATAEEMSEVAIQAKFERRNYPTKLHLALEA